jgi:hypothetical protein
MNDSWRKVLDEILWLYSVPPLSCYFQQLELALKTFRIQNGTVIIRVDNYAGVIVISL